MSADQRERRGFHQKLHQNVMPPRTRRFPDADLARSLGYRNKHDVHHDDSADNQRNRGDPDRDGKKRPADIGPDLQKVVVCIEGKIILGVVSKVPPGPQTQPDLAFSRRNMLLVQRFCIDGYGTARPVHFLMQASTE